MHPPLRRLLPALLLIPAFGVANELPRCEPMPRVMIAARPEYPRIPEGPPRATVTLEFTIRTDGDVIDPIVIDNWPQDSERWFDGPALDAIMRMKFKPVPFECRATKRIEFRRPD